MALLPAPSGTGIVFRRSDLAADIPARYDRVCDTRLGTVLAEGGARAGVVEHLMAALAAAEIHDIYVEIDGPEPPILDGDALSYLTLIDSAGIRKQAGAVRRIRVVRAVRAGDDNAHAALYPHDGRRFEFEIAFAAAVIGRQQLSFDLDPGAFRREIAPARTFGMLSDLDRLLAAGLSQGATLANTLAVDGDQLANPELQRFPDEFVRHKILDAIGDLALAGAPIIGRFEGYRSSHALNHALLVALFGDPANYVVEG